MCPSSSFSFDLSVLTFSCDSLISDNDPLLGADCESDELSLRIRRRHEPSLSGISTDVLIALSSFALPSCYSRPGGQHSLSPPRRSLSFFAFLLLRSFAHIEVITVDDDLPFPKRFLLFLAAAAGEDYFSSLFSLLIDLNLPNIFSDF